MAKFMLALGLIAILGGCASNMTPYQKKLAIEQREKAMAEPSLYDFPKRR
jgi:uncharacterized protein YjeT (DUF2065 family)